MCIVHGSRQPTRSKRDIFVLDGHKSKAVAAKNIGWTTDVR